MVAECGDRTLQMVPAHVVDDGVDPVRCRLRQQLADRAVVVVEGRVETEFTGQPCDLRGRARAADDPSGAEEPGDPAHRRSDPARGGGDEQVLARPELQCAGERHIGGQARAAEDGEMGGQGHPFVRAELAGAVDTGRDQGVGAPAVPVEDQVALGEGGVAGVDDPADRAALQRGVQFPAAVHLLAVVRVHGEVEVLHQGLARAGDGDRGLGQGEETGSGESRGAGGQVEGEGRACRRHGSDRRKESIGPAEGCVDGKTVSMNAVHGNGNGERGGSTP